MSRNIGSSACCLPVVVEETPRLITEDEAGRYYQEFRTLYVANAHCPVCGAKYLAWFSDGYGHSRIRSNEVRDLSYRSSFNDEPDDADLPTHEVRRVFEVRPITGGEWTIYREQENKP